MMTRSHSDTALARRTFLVRMVRSASHAGAFLLPLSGFVSAAEVEPTDTRVASQTITIDTPSGLSGYLAQPTKPGKYPGVIILHDLSGITPFIEDVARRFAAEGFVALAPDYHTITEGAAAQDPSRELLKMTDVNTSAAAMAAASALRALEICSGKIGAVGFGWGGTAVNYLPLYDFDLGAAIGYYGLQPLYFQDDSYRAMTTPVQMHFAGRDILTNESIAIYEHNLSEAEKYFETYMYAGAERGFVDGNDASVFDGTAAELAWQRTIAFLNKHLQ
jgi:carboxymethylenebutenolidase